MAKILYHPHAKAEAKLDYVSAQIMYGIVCDNITADQDILYQMAQDELDKTTIALYTKL